MFVPSTRIRSVSAQAASGFGLGPLLDNFHGQYGVLVYDAYQISGPLFESALWVPPLFAFAAVAIGVVAGNGPPPKLEDTLRAILAFVAVYWFSGALQQHQAASYSLMLLWPLGLSFLAFDPRPRTLAACVATAVAGPSLELLLTSSTSLYHYTHPDFYTINSWIPAVYFAGAPPVAMLWRYLSLEDE